MPVTDAEGVIRYYKDGYLHNDEGPAVIYPEGAKLWFSKGLCFKREWTDTVPAAETILKTEARQIIAPPEISPTPKCKHKDKNVKDLTTQAQEAVTAVIAKGHEKARYLQMKLDAALKLNLSQCGRKTRLSSIINEARLCL
jgi:hypothetical protein